MPDSSHPTRRGPGAAGARSPGVFLILGPSGSGKGTVAERLRSDGLLGAHLSMGELLRGLLERVQNDPQASATLETALEGDMPDGFSSRVAYLKHAVRMGLLIPDAWTQTVIEHELSAHPILRTTPWVLDGYPRRISAASHLLQTLERAGIPVLGVIHLHLPLEVMRARLLSRGREDDTPDAIMRRYAFYTNSVLPTLEYLRDQLGTDHVWNVDANDTPDAVYTRVRHLVEQALKKTPS
jgi:adenylate kinase